jgi:hypothetical protein
MSLTLAGVSVHPMAVSPYGRFAVSHKLTLEGRYFR